MLEKWKQRAIQMNFRKAVLIFVAASFIIILGLSAALYVNFNGRIKQWEIKTSQEYQDDEEGYGGNDFAREDYWKEYTDKKWKWN